jgi:hypothetical protein
MGLWIPECCGQAVGPGYLRMVDKYGAQDTWVLWAGSGPWIPEDGREVLGLRIPGCCGQAVGPGFLRMV